MSDVPRLRADFNGLFDDLLCLSHADTCPDQHGNAVALQAGMRVVAYEDDCDAEGNPDQLLAEGTVEPAPDWMSCRGSKWVLRIDEPGVYHASERPPGRPASSSAITAPSSPPRC